LGTGCAQALVAQVSKHRDPRMLERYHSSSKISLLSSSRLEMECQRAWKKQQSKSKRQRIITSDEEEQKQGDVLTSHHKHSYSNHKSTSSSVTVVKNNYFNLREERF